MKSLPEEIIHEEILPKLPVKSLLKFRCVSKSWLSVIGSKRFIKTQHEISKTDPSFLKQSVILQNKTFLPMQCSLQSVLSEKPINPSPLEYPTNTQVLGCYNGLVCIRKNEGEFNLWNPSTRKCKKLPEFATHGPFVENCGFGWDESSGEYKVFALMRVRDSDSNYKGRVYSSKTQSWKTIEHNFIYKFDTMMAGVFVGGKLHWIENYNNIIFLDLKSDVFGRIELPIDDKGYRYGGCGKIGGWLCLLYDHCYYGRRNTRAWVMKESWERLMDLSLDHELLQRPFSASSFAYRGSNGEIFVFDGPTLLVYDPRKNEFRFPKVRYEYFSSHVYIESLLSPEDV